MTFPILRLRRLRKTPLIRDMVAETHLRVQQLVYPLFICDRPDTRIAVESMPGIYQQSINNAEREIEQALKLGVRQFILFGIPDEKDAEATSAWTEDGIIQRALRHFRNSFGSDLTLIADTCLCEYTHHGHCGIVMDGTILNDPSLEILGKVALAQAEAGADIIAPSDMMDGRIMWIRQALDDAGYQDTPIMSYAAKYASSFYAPFRDAAESTPTFGDRKTYQMDPRNRREALDEILSDLTEGADIIMVKPAMAYQDIIYQARQLCNVPIAAYSVSGEYAMIKAAALQGWIDESSVVLEQLTGIARAGADILITYHALDAARWLQQRLGTKP